MNLDVDGVCSYEVSLEGDTKYAGMRSENEAITQFYVEELVGDKVLIEAQGENETLAIEIDREDVPKIIKELEERKP